MATTEDELIGYVLDNFAAVGSGQTAAAEDVGKVRPYVGFVLSDLADCQIIFIPDGDSVPDAAVPWVSTLIAHAPGLRRYFGELNDIPSAEYCRTRLRSIAPTQDYPVLQATYF